VGLATAQQKMNKLNEYLDELEFLADTAGAIVVRRFVQNLSMPDSRTYVGSGKVQEMAEFIRADEKIDLVIVDDELSPSQLRNLETELKCTVIDRTNLILDIFAKRAQTSHAKTQVELAQYQYLLPRLTRMWTHLERQQGGIGTRGPGETEIETDRRIIRDRIAFLKKRLETIDKQMASQRKNRGNMLRLSLVGYTNVGKSTIMNMLSKSEVFAENKLFATLDTTVRKTVIHNLPFLLADTVGFIRKLPHNLVESFKSTLDEVREADVLLHVVDISHPEFEDQIKVVNETLAEIKSNDKPMIMVFNKIDAYQWHDQSLDENPETENPKPSLQDLMNTYMAKENAPCIFISAKNKENLNEFRQLIYDSVKKAHADRFPFENFLY
jgi:GTP-binding protein HflX